MKFWLHKVSLLLLRRYDPSYSKICLKETLLFGCRSASSTPNIWMDSPPKKVWYTAAKFLNGLLPIEFSWLQLIKKCWVKQRVPQLPLDIFARCHLQVVTLEQPIERGQGQWRKLSKELLLVDVAAKNLLERLVAAFPVPICIFSPTPDEFSTWASRCCLVDRASCEDHTIAPAPYLWTLYCTILYFCKRNYHLYRAKVRFRALNQFRFNTHQLNLSMCPLHASCMCVMHM